MRDRSWAFGPFNLRSGIAFLTTLALILGISAVNAPVAEAAKGPNVYTLSKAGPKAISAPTVKPVAVLSVPPGRYFVTAKAVIVGAGGSHTSIPVAECRLHLGASVDKVTADPFWQHGNASRIPILLTVAGRLGQKGKIRLSCVGAANTGDAQIRDIRITATGVGKLTMRNAGQPDKIIGSGNPKVISSSGPAVRTLNGGNVLRAAHALSLPAGRWWIIAKGVAQNARNYNIDMCTLVAGGDHDDLRFPISLGGEVGSFAPLALQVVHVFDSPGAAWLLCRGAADFDISHTAITAIRVGGLTNRNLDSATSWTRGFGSPRVISGWSNGPRPVAKGTRYRTIRKLVLPKGRWTLLAKLWFEADSMPVDPVILRKVSCRLRFGGDEDRVEIRHGNNMSRFSPMVLSLSHRATSTQKVKLQCRRTNAPGNGNVHFIKITAMKDGSLTQR